MTKNIITLPVGTYLTFSNGSTIYYSSQPTDKKYWTVEQWESCHRIKKCHRKFYPNAAKAYENKRIQILIQKTPLYQAMQENE